MTWTTTASPIGDLVLVAGTDRDEAGGAALVGVYMTEHRHAPDPSTFGPRVEGGDEGEAGVLAAAAAQLAEYFAGERRAFDLPTAAAGTPFQRAVWAQLALIGHGETSTYGELAVRLGNPRAVRAVGLANGRNPLSIVVPCHRVLGAGGALTGFGGGTSRKRFLLDLEARTAGTTRAAPTLFTDLP